MTAYKIEWDLAASFDSNNGAPAGYYLKAVTLNNCQATHCSYVINGLTKVGGISTTTILTTTLS